METEIVQGPIHKHDVRTVPAYRAHWCGNASSVEFELKEGIKVPSNSQSEWILVQGTGTGTLPQLPVPCEALTGTFVPCECSRPWRSRCCRGRCGALLLFVALSHHFQLSCSCHRTTRGVTRLTVSAIAVTVTWLCLIPRLPLSFICVCVTGRLSNRQLRTGGVHRSKREAGVVWKIPPVHTRFRSMPTLWAHGELPPT